MSFSYFMFTYFSVTILTFNWHLHFWFPCFDVTPLSEYTNKIVFFFRMSNINSNSHTSKLRSNESSKYRFRDRLNSDCSLQIDSVAYGCLQNSNVREQYI